MAETAWRNRLNVAAGERKSGGGGVAAAGSMAWRNGGWRRKRNGENDVIIGVAAALGMCGGGGVECRLSSERQSCGGVGAGGSIIAKNINIWWRRS
jgi:hypothetical protein